MESGRPEFELYDMQNDPGQMDNVYGKTSFKQVNERLESELARWQEETGDTNLNKMIKTFSR